MGVLLSTWLFLLLGWGLPKLPSLIFQIRVFMVSPIISWILQIILMFDAGRIWVWYSLINQCLGNLKEICLVAPTHGEHSHVEIFHLTSIWQKFGSGLLKQIHASSRRYCDIAVDWLATCQHHKIMVSCLPYLLHGNPYNWKDGLQLILKQDNGF